jgi:hypothetical protein
LTADEARSFTDNWTDLYYDAVPPIMLRPANLRGYGNLAWTTA